MKRANFTANDLSRFRMDFGVRGKRVKREGCFLLPNSLNRNFQQAVRQIYSKHDVHGIPPIIKSKTWRDYWKHVKIIKCDENAWKTGNFIFLTFEDLRKSMWSNLWRTKSSTFYQEFGSNYTLFYTILYKIAKKSLTCSKLFLYSTSSGLL